MKLAEALILRADCQKRIEQIKSRLLRNVKVQEGETPAEEPKKLFSELNATLDELNNLIKRINKTNSNMMFDDKRTISDAIADRDKIWKKRHILHNVSEVAIIKQEVFTHSEVKFLATIKVADLQSEIDRLSKEFREIDTNLQEKNWNTELE